MSQFALQKPHIDTVTSLYKFYTTVDVLRLDAIHPEISGNKWFKLKNYLEQAAAEGKNTIVTFGGAYSNHIVATAAACRHFGFKSIGIIRGEKPAFLSPSLQSAAAAGMKLFFLSRTAYRQKQLPPELEGFDKGDICIIPEGGYGAPGVEGASTILGPGTRDYTHIMAAVGTGTTLAGLVLGRAMHQRVIGVPVLKKGPDLEKEIQALLPAQAHQSFELVPGFHFGGYAKKNDALLRFMNDFYSKTGIPSDFVYTAKLFYAVNELLQTKHLPLHAKVLVIHSGGLQGNASLPKGTLIF